MRVLALSFLLGFFGLPSARACEPEDATVVLESTGDGFVFVSRNTLVRVDAPASVVHRRDIGFTSDAVLLPDRRNLLRAVGTGAGGSCTVRSYRFERLDTTRGGRPRRLGTFPRGERFGTGLEAMSLVGDHVEAVLVAYTADENERWLVRADASRAEGERITQPASSPHTADVDGERQVARFGPLRVVETGDAGGPDDRISRVVVRGASRPLVRLEIRDLIAATFAGRGRYLGVASWEVVNEDWGTGFDARLDVVDLHSGQVHTPHGEAGGVRHVSGRVALRCTMRVDDPDSPLNVRDAPRGGSRVVATLPHDTEVTIAEARGNWRRLSAPRAGWVWHENLTESCGLP